MMLDTTHINIMIECDECGACFDCHSRDILDTWEAAQEDGWQAKKVDGLWVYSCPECGVYS